jgi:hypothetical protein
MSEEDLEQYPRALAHWSKQLRFIGFCIFAVLVALWAYTMFINMRPTP